MALILLGFRRFPAFETRMEVNAMQHHNSVFHQLTKHIPWGEFDRLVEKHHGDHRVRSLNCRSQLFAVMFGQLSGASSLRQIEAGLESHRSRLYPSGAKCVKRSTLADANASRPWQLFADLFSHMAGAANRGTRHKMKDITRIMDATRIRLSRLSADWSHFTGSHCAAKLHIVYNPHTNSPVFADVTPEKVNDIVVGQQLELEPGATYVFDLAYYDYTWWAKMDGLGCRFVTRLKSHTKLHDTTVRDVPQGSNILSDSDGYLPKRQKRNGRNPMNKKVREIVVRISTGKIIRLVSNDLKAPAQQIADLYKQRWDIEQFFKWIKQNLKIKTFLGTSENAVRIQLYVALITYLLLRLVHQSQTEIKQASTFVKLISLNLMHRKPISALRRPPDRSKSDHRQNVLELFPC